MAKKKYYMLTDDVAAVFQQYGATLVALEGVEGKFIEESAYQGIYQTICDDLLFDDDDSNDYIVDNIEAAAMNYLYWSNEAYVIS